MGAICAWPDTGGQRRLGDPTCAIKVLEVNCWPSLLAWSTLSKGRANNLRTRILGALMNHTTQSKSSLNIQYSFSNDGCSITRTSLGDSPFLAFARTGWR
jgi:hypothetical protein